MKKVNPKKYAKALYEVVDELDGFQVQAEIKNFVKLLAKNKDLRLADKIIIEFEKYSKEQAGILDVEVISAKVLTGAAKKELIDQIKKERKVEQVEIVNLEDVSLIGGLIVKIGDTVLDGSLKTRLELLKRELQQ